MLNPIKEFFKSPPWEFLVPLFTVIVLLTIETVAILVLNSGKFTFSLDDPYIHLNLADKIIKGHYGVNWSAYSSASSSIIWPFILALFSVFKGTDIVCLGLNMGFAIATLYLDWKILDRIFNTISKQKYPVLIMIVLLLFILLSNLVGLVFMGMEHSLQLLLVTGIFYGVIRSFQEPKIHPLMPLVMVLAPLVRYENLAITVPLLIYFYCSNHKKLAVQIGFFTLFTVVGFSLFLDHLGLALLPNSVIVKMDSSRLNIFQKTYENIEFHRSLLLTIGGFIFLKLIFIREHLKNKEFKFGCAVALFYTVTFISRKIRIVLPI